MEGDEYKLPIDEKCLHALWKVRVAGYEEAFTLFSQIEDDKSWKWNKFLGLIKKFVTDSNAIAQEKGMEAALVFVERCGNAGMTTGEVMSGIVAKCVAAPKSRTKDLALQLTLMYIYIEKHEVVQEELMKGMEHKNPKVVTACVSTLNIALKQFGNKVITIKPMVKKIPVLLAGRNKGVRDEMKAFVVEMHRWIGGAIEPHIATLQAVVQQELRDSFATGGAQPTRCLRSQQHRAEDTSVSDTRDGATEDEADNSGAGDSANMDPYELLGPVEILTRLPKDFYQKLESKKWQERKKALDALDNLLKTASRLEPGDYADLVRALKKVITKDSNVVLVRNKFQPYATACVQAILEKFREKKANVVAALREAIDAVYPAALIKVKVARAVPKKEAKPKAPTASARGDHSAKTAGSTQPKPVKKPAQGAAEKVDAAQKGARVLRRPPAESPLSQDNVDGRAVKLLPANTIQDLGDAHWTTRLYAVLCIRSAIKGLTADDGLAQVLYRVLNKKPGLKDPNRQVARERLVACRDIADKFSVSTIAADFVLHDVVAKLGEAAFVSIAKDCLTSLADACGFEHVFNEGLSYAMDSQENPEVQLEMFNWMSIAIKKFGFTTNVSSVVAHSKKALSATNPNVRTCTINFLGILSLYVSPSLITHFDSEDPDTKERISLVMEINANRSPPSTTRQPGNVSESRSDLEGSTDEEEGPSVVETSRPGTDLAPLITAAILSQINDKDWSVRSEALAKLKGLITKSSPLKPNLGDLPPALVARLQDANSKLAQSALQICEQLAAAIGPKCKTHVRTFFPVFFQLFGDKKQWIRTAAVACVSTWCATAGRHVALEGGMVVDALKLGSPLLRSSLLHWLAEHLPSVPLKSFPREELLSCVPTLYACIEDRAVDVRTAAGDCVLPFMLHLGYESMHKLLEKLKLSSKSVVQAALDKARPNLPVQPMPIKSKKDPRAPPQRREMDKKDPRTLPQGQEKRAMKPSVLKTANAQKNAAPTKAKVPAKPASASSHGTKDEDDLTPLLPQNNCKNQRIADDQKHKVPKWNFKAPRQEFFDLLKDQMATAGLNKQLVANMFHKDFRYHLKAIESLSADFQENRPALICNLDLVLKWLTLRFFDTNPSVILKGLEYLVTVFQFLSENDYAMSEFEANCFIPYLILKVGDPKDMIRNRVKALFKQICVVYSVTKLFRYLMEGLKSNNARQRAECLECIGSLMETYGWSAMRPSGAVALKELARHIEDRDSTVRSAALNCVTCAYFLEGEKIYKMIGQIADKSLSLLEERIKRASKSRSAEIQRSMVVPLAATGQPIKQQTKKTKASTSRQPPPQEEEEEQMP